MLQCRYEMKYVNTQWCRYSLYEVYAGAYLYTFTFAILSMLLVTFAFTFALIVVIPSNTKRFPNAPAASSARSR